MCAVLFYFSLCVCLNVCTVVVAVVVCPVSVCVCEATSIQQVSPSNQCLLSVCISVWAFLCYFFLVCLCERVYCCCC